MAFSSCQSRKRVIQGSHGRPQESSAGVLAMAFSLCLSMKRQFQGSPGRPWESSAGVLAMAFSPCLSRKRPSHGLGARLRWPFPPACRGKGRIVDLVCVCDGLFPLPVEEKAVSWTWCALAMAFPPCLSRKRPFHGLGSRSRWPFPSACRGKGRIVDLACACDGLFPLPVEEKSV